MRKVYCTCCKNPIVSKMWVAGDNNAAICPICLANTCDLMNILYLITNGKIKEEFENGKNNAGKCTHCGKSLSACNATSFYCSEECYNAAKKES